LRPSHIKIHSKLGCIHTHLLLAQIASAEKSSPEHE